MKVTVKFGSTAVVVPCKDGWMVRDLIHQATQRYKKIVGQDGEFVVWTHHVEYIDGGILDPDDLLADLVEDKDKLIAVFDETELQQGVTVTPGGSVESSCSSPDPSEPSTSSEIEVTSSTLRSTTPLLVRSSSDPALAPPLDAFLLDHKGSSRPQPTGDLTGGVVDKTKEDVPNTRPGHINMSGLTRTVEISGETGPLGINVVPYSSSLSGRPLGLHIRSVEENSQLVQEGIFKEDECIVRINDVELIDKTFSQSQEVFHQAMSSSKVRLEVLPVDNRLRYEKRLIGQLFTNNEPPKAKSPFLVHKPSPEPAAAQTPPLKEGELPLTSHAPVQAEQPKDTPSPPVSASSTLKDRCESPAPKRTLSIATLVHILNKKSGKKMRIDLKKGTEGLGFTVVTRDSSLHGLGPILVKSILPRGAAVKDGRLKSGDRILEVNGVDITGRTQEELVAMLRSTKFGETVSMIVSRELKGESSGPLLSQDEDGQEQLMFDVPLNDSGSAGLGVSLKGNKSLETGEDLGIFIKSIIPGGAAHKDGRLHTNDRLIAVNNESLLGRSNHDAMETLRGSMSTKGNLKRTIQLVVLRSQERPPAQKNHEVSQTLARRDSPVQQPNGNQTSSFIPSAMVNNCVYEASPDRSHVRKQELPEEDYSEEDFPPPPSDEDLTEASSPCKHLPERVEKEPAAPVSPPTNQHYPQRRMLSEHPTTKTSRSMELEPLPSNGSVLGPRLGLQKSSSLERLQTAMEEPFHRPHTHMVRGRGWNLSFRYAIDKSYDGPSEPENDNFEEDSGRDTPASSSLRQQLDDDRKMKKTRKKKKKTSKEKDEPEDQEKRNTRKAFGLLSTESQPDLRSVPRNMFGRKNGEEKIKARVKQLGALSEEAADKTEPEISLSKSERSSVAAHRVTFSDVQDDDLDPNYARINNFREPPASSHPPYPPGTPTHNPPQRSVPAPHREPPNRDALEGLYAKVNKQRTTPSKSDSTEDHWQPIRNQLQQVRPAPSYDDVTARRRQDSSRIRGPDPRMTPRYDTDQQCVSVPRRIPVEEQNQNLAGQREPSHYPNPSYDYSSQKPHHDSYPSCSARLPVPRHEDRPAGYYLSSPDLQRAPVRQDLPPSPSPGARAPPRYDTLIQGNYRTASLDHYGAYGDERYQDPRQKNPMIGAV